MYCDFYQLRERPFNVTADPKFLYLNSRYREALASLQYGISQRKGFVTLIGEAGTGKTTLLKKLLDELDPTTRSVFIFNTNVTFDEILEYIFAEFDLPIHNGKRLYMLQRLNAFLLEQLHQGRNVTLLIDEAQDLDPNVLEDLRLLSNLETAKEKILQIVLSGQPELEQKLASPSLRQLRQRVAINCRLLPLAREEITEYIQSRLSAAGGEDPKLFSRDAEDRIFEISQGIPRIVNVVCDNALVIGYALGRRRLGGDVITEAAADLLSTHPVDEAADGDEPGMVAVPAPPRTRRWSQLGVVAVVAIAIVLGLLSVGRSFWPRLADHLESATAARPPLEVVPPGARVAADRTLQDLQQRRIVPLGREANQEPSAREPDRPAAPNANAPDAVTEPAVPPPDEPVAEAAPAEDPVHLPSEEPVVAPPRPVAPPPAAESAPAARKMNQQDANFADARAAALHAPAPNDRTTGAADSLARGTDTAKDDAAGELNDSPRFEGPVGLALNRYQPVVVNPGQSVSEIVVRKYGQASDTILDMVKLANPDLRNVDVVAKGQTVRLPELDEGLVVLRQKDGHYGLLLLSSPVWQRVKGIEVVLRERGFQAQVGQADFGKNKTVYRLMITGLPGRDAAVEVGKKVQRLFREDEQIAALAR